MASKIRIQFPHAFYHIFNRGVDKRKIFLEEIDYHHFLSLLNALTEKYKFKVYSFCLMPNHFHFFIHTIEANIAPLMRDLMSKYVLWFNKKYNRTGRLFEERYKDIIIDKNLYSLRLTKYIHLNPVKAKIVKSPKDWLWSSYRLYFSEAESRRYKFFNSKFILKQLGKNSRRRLTSFTEHDAFLPWDSFLNSSN